MLNGAIERIQCQSGSPDDAQPVTTYTAKEPFKGSISQLKFSTP
jgi:hypothetical protein